MEVECFESSYFKIKRYETCFMPMTYNVITMVNIPSTTVKTVRTLHIYVKTQNDSNFTIEFSNTKINPCRMMPCLSMGCLERALRGKDKWNLQWCSTVHFFFSCPHFPQDIHVQGRKGRQRPGWVKLGLILSVCQEGWPKEGLLLGDLNRALYHKPSRHT